VSLKFTNPAFRLTPPDYNRVTLAESPIVSHPLGGFEVPEGFECDLESVPRLVQILPGMEEVGKGAIPGVIHDWLYKTGLVSKPEADSIYLEAMRQRNVPVLTRYAKYVAVRLFGGAAWRAHRKNDNAT